MTTPSGDNSFSPRRATATRDAMPLPDAARRVIRNQRGGNINSIRGVQILQRNTLSSTRSSGRVLTPQMQQAHGALGGSQRVPTLQEMYNTWRSLEDQFSQMRRLPMFVKAELKFCHGCRILKIRCTCFDYSQLEVGYQERDRILRHAALYEFPGEGDEGEEDSVAKTEPTTIEPTIGTPSTTLSGPPTTPNTHQTLAPESSTSPGTFGWAPVEMYSPFVQEGSPYTQSTEEVIAAAHSMYGAPAAVQNPEAYGFDFNTAMARSAIQTSTVPPSPLASRGTSHGSLITTPPTLSSSTGPPTLVKFELRTILMAKEKIGAQSRRWQCQYGLSDGPLSPVCKREDDNMDTIRRHYGREHGSHRYHKKPALRIRCSHCDLEYDKQRPPTKCPGCKVDRGIWLREIFAVIEVPVPLSGHGDGSIGGGPNYPGSGGSSGFGGFGGSGMFGGSAGSGASDIRGPFGAGGYGSVGGSGGPGSPGGFHGTREHIAHLACAQQVESPMADIVKYDSGTGMPECYNDICNNTTAVPVMPPPNVFANTSSTHMQRPSSSSSSATAQSRSMSMSRSLSQAHSPFTQGFYAVGRGLPMSPSAHMAHTATTPSMSPGLPMSPISPDSNAGSANDTETTAAIAAGYTDLHTGGSVRGQSHTLASPSAQQLALSTSINMADVQKFMDMAAVQVVPSVVSPARGQAITNNNKPLKGKCAVESEFFYFAD